jgi:predicted nucleic acid-binding protein
LTVTEPIVMELLAGARSDRHLDDLTRLMASMNLLAFDAVVDFEAAARIDRRCRADGVTPRGMIDCMIAAVAWRCGATLLSCEVDLSRVASVIELQMDEASVR